MVDANFQWLSAALLLDLDTFLMAIMSWLGGLAACHSS